MNVNTTPRCTKIDRPKNKLCSYIYNLKASIYCPFIVHRVKLFVSNIIHVMLENFKALHDEFHRLAGNNRPSPAEGDEDT